MRIDPEIAEFIASRSAPDLGTYAAYFEALSRLARTPAVAEALLGIAGACVSAAEAVGAASQRHAVPSVTIGPAARSAPRRRT
jgi:hypothetical protein